MKKSVVFLLIAIFLAGCSGTFKQSEFMDHDKMYKNWDHMKFSWFGYRNPTAADQQKSIDQKWWGFEYPYVPGQ